MIDLDRLRKEPAAVTKALYKKDPSYRTQKLIDLDDELRSLRSEVEQLRAQKNEYAQQAKSGITPALREQSVQLGQHLKIKETSLQLVQKAFNDHYLRCPNIPFEELPIGNKEANRVIKTYGQQPAFDFKPKHHLELAKDLTWFDTQQGALVAASGFIFYHQDAVKLSYALKMFMLKNNMSFGYELTLPPSVVNEESLIVASNFPKFSDEVYAIPTDNLYLIPTAEVSLANLHRDTIFMHTDLPKRYTAATNCFRREAGGYGAQERGLIRIHEFEKAELFTYCLPQDAQAELERMLECAETILQALGLHYQVSLLATQDCSFPSAKTYDLEVWMPGQGVYKEVSSCSNCTDFQARRGLIRYKMQQDDKARLVHTLNGSSLALPRLMAALIETYQNPDGSISIPEALKGYGFY